MENQQRNPEIVRKPILTSSNSRNAENHPEFLDTDMLLERFEPLLKSIHKRFCSYDHIFEQPDDIDDLYNQIVYEFLRLKRSYDPKRGVDFPGYIKFHLQQRVYHYVIKKQKLIKNEQPINMKNNEEGEQYLALENYSKLTDEESESTMEKIEAIASIPWSKLSEEDSELIKDILIKGESIESIAKRKRVTIKSIKTQLDSVCDLLVDLHNLNTYYD